MQAESAPHSQGAALQDDATPTPTPPQPATHPGSTADVIPADIAREHAALCAMFGATPPAPTAPAEPTPPPAPPPTPAPAQSLSEGEVVARFGKEALLRLAVESDGYTAALQARVRELCTLLLQEQSESKLALLSAAESALDMFARPHRRPHIAPRSAQHQEMWLQGELGWMQHLAEALSQILRHRRVKRDVLQRCLAVGLLGLETFGQSLFASTPQGLQALQVLVRTASLEVEVGAAEARKVEGRAVPDAAVQTACTAARILEWCVAYLVDEDGEYPVAEEAHRWQRLQHSDISLLSGVLVQTHSELVAYFLDAEGEVRAPMDIALFPLLSALMEGFDTHTQDTTRKLVAFFKARGVPV